MNKENCVVDAYGAEAVIKTLELPSYDPITPYQKEKYLRKKEIDQHGTVGAVALDRDGNLASATSTGGQSFGVPGRISDSCMPASTFASKHVAISCTGIGEHIMRHTFNVKARTIELFGRKQIRDAITAINELVKNAYDADSEYIEMHFVTEAADNDAIIITILALPSA